MDCLETVRGHLVQTGLGSPPYAPQQFTRRSNIHPDVDIFLFGRHITFHLADHLTFEWTPMAESILYPRFVRYRLEEARRDTPVVLVHGPRHCGKTNLARLVGEAAGYEYITFDDDVQLAAANANPVGFMADLAGKTVLDEVQRAPALFLALNALDMNWLKGLLPAGFWCTMVSMWLALAKNCMQCPSAHFGN